MQTDFVRFHRGDCADYVAFLNGLPEDNLSALGYHYPFYLNFVADQVHDGKADWQVLCIRKESEIQAAIPLICIREKSIRSWLSIAYFGANGGVIGKAGAEEFISILLKEVIHRAEEEKADSLTLYTPIGAHRDTYAEALGSCEAEVHRFTQCKKLNPDPNVSQWKQSVRYDVKIAPKEGAICRAIETEEELQTVWNIYHQNCLDRNIPVKDFKQILYLFKHASENGIFLICEYQQQIIGGLIVWIGGRVMSYYLPCSLDEFRWMQTNLFLLDQAIQLALPKGIRYLNFEGSPDMEGGVFQFKKRCGGELMYFDIFIKALQPDLKTRLKNMGETAIRSEFPNTFIFPFQKLNE